MYYLEIDYNKFPKQDRLNGIEDGRVMLIVDDVGTNRAVLRYTFEHDYIIVEKENGLEAWEYLLEHSNDVEIVMLDLLMPVMDGFELLEKIRTHELMNHIPIVITSQGDLGAEHKTLEMQANDYIVKPYDPENVYRRVSNVIGNYKYQCLRHNNDNIN